MQPVLNQSVLRVVLADDHDLVRAGIKSLLSQIEGLQVVAEARDGQELVRLVKQLEPDLVLTDISMPGMGGLEAIDRIHLTQPNVRLLVLTTYSTGDFVRRAVASGACGYLMKDAALQELERAVRSVMTTGSYFTSAIAKMLVAPDRRGDDDRLTRRQVEIVKLIAQGLGSKQIGFELGISSKTVDVHRARLMERLNINDVASLTVYAVRMGLVQV